MARIVTEKHCNVPLLNEIDSARQNLNKTNYIGKVKPLNHGEIAVTNFGVCPSNPLDILNN